MELLVNNEIKHELENEDIPSKDMPQMDHEKFCKQFLSRIKVSSLLLPLRFLRITDQEWSHIKFLVKQRQEKELNALDEIKKQLWGKRTLRQEKMTELQQKDDQHDFMNTYEEIYKFSAEFMDYCIKSVEDEFEEKQTQNFDYIKSMYEAKHNSHTYCAHEHSSKEDAHHEDQTKKRHKVEKENLTIEEKYKIAIKFQKQQRKKLEQLVKDYDVKLKTEFEIARPIRNVMSCELQHNAYQNLYKKGIFFDTMDKPKLHMELRLKTILNSINTLDKCHK